MRLPVVRSQSNNNRPIQTPPVQYKKCRHDRPQPTKYYSLNSNDQVVPFLSTKSDHSAGQNREKIKKFLPPFHKRVTKIGGRKNGPNFASKVTIRVIIEGRVFLQPSTEKTLMRKYVDA